MSPALSPFSYAESYRISGVMLMPNALQGFPQDSLMALYFTTVTTLVDMPQTAITTLRQIPVAPMTPMGMGAT